MTVHDGWSVSLVCGIQDEHSVGVLEYVGPEGEISRNQGCPSGKVAMI